ncbi:hypothetical protein [Henriciella aquimarina]|uniref:hypothetical protein n=1 Tax=Henriciella aquimarina TaxID=545261 RepID=UPI001179A395|nr:hypothetical protein [Henriciella aquimarina]
MSIHQQVVSHTGSPYCYVAPEKMEQAMGAHGLHRCRSDEVKHALALGEALLGAPLARAEVVSTLDAITQMTFWVTGQPVNGLYLTLPLTEEGRSAVEDGTFRPGDPALRHVAPARTPIFGLYVGVYAGATKDARRNIMAASATVRVALYGPVPCYARGATEDGARSMLSLGFRRFEGGLSDLFVFDPVC